LFACDATSTACPGRWCHDRAGRHQPLRGLWGILWVKKFMGTLAARRGASTKGPTMTTLLQKRRYSLLASSAIITLAGAFALAPRPALACNSGGVGAPDLLSSANCQSFGTTGVHSIAIGRNAHATGTDGTAVGDQAGADGANGTAFGSLAFAAGA